MDDIVERLRECPFCGGEVEIVIGFRDDHGFGVRCKQLYCRVSTRGHPTREQAVAAWNRSTPKAADRIAALVEALGFYADHENWWGAYVADSRSPMNDDWGDPTDDFPDGKPGKRARAALATKEKTDGAG